MSEHEEEVEGLFSGAGPRPYHVLVAETDEGEVVGFAELSTRPYAEGCVTSPVGFLEGWYVEPDHRGSGVGRMLVEAGEEWARRLGLTELASDTDLENEAGAAIHAAVGFEEVGRIRCFRKELE